MNKQTIITVAGIVSALFAGTAVTNAAKEAPDQAPPAPTLQAQCAMPFRDNAVLQQKIKLPVWGTSLPGAKVTVRFDGQSQSTPAGPDGMWRVMLKPMDAVKLKSVNDCPAGKTMSIDCEKRRQEGGQRNQESRSRRRLALRRPIEHGG
jgi:hypothetical protein